DALVYVVLDSFVYASETITACTIQAGAYGSSNASRVGIVTFTNSATISHLRPDVAVVTPPYQLFTTSITPEVAVVHPYGQSSRMAACVIFTIYDSSGVSTGVTATST